MDKPEFRVERGPAATDEPFAVGMAKLLEREGRTIAAAELRRLHAVNQGLLEALKNLEKEFRKVYPIYYYAEPWGHKTNVPLQAARAAIEAALKEKNA
jgi:hypothetical protein